MAEIQWNNPANKDYGMVRMDRGDEDLVVLFYWKSEQDIRESKDRGIPVYRDIEYVKMFRPGELLNQIIRPVQESDKFRFPRQWQQFTLNKTQTPEGTPIDLLFINNPSVADTLRGMGVYTIQQLAALSAHAVDAVGMGGQEWVNKAQQYLQAATSGKEVVKMQDEMRRMSADMRRKDEQIAALMQQVNTLIKTMQKTDTTNPPEIKSDPVAERINANHVSGELGKRLKK